MANCFIKLRNKFKYKQLFREKNCYFMSVILQKNY